MLLGCGPREIGFGLSEAAKEEGGEGKRIEKLIFGFAHLFNGCRIYAYLYGCIYG